jgi:hypothetical protein
MYFESKRMLAAYTTSGFMELVHDLNSKCVGKNNFKRESVVGEQRGVFPSFGLLA